MHPTAVTNLAPGSLSNTQKAVLTILRIAIGWHFLYEGVAKIFDPGWSAAPYLQTSTGIFADFFQWIVATPWVLRLVDLFNIWGLAAIGLGLMLGFLTRPLSVLGIVLLSMYYLAHPPFMGGDFRIPTEGHYLVINKNMIELLALILFVVFPTRALAGLDRLFLDFRAWLHEKKQGNTKKASADGREPLQAMNRRELVGNLAAFPAVGLLGYGAYKKREFERVHGTTGATITLREVALKDLNGELPTGSLGNLKVSRLILGSNLIGAVAHCRDLLYVQHLFKAYNTERKIFETIELAQKSGINMIQLVPGQYPMFHKYCRLVSDGMQTMCAVTATVQDMKTDIDKAIDAGATTIYVHGLFAERFVQAGRIDLLGKCVDYIKSQGYLAGIGGHSIEVVVQAENAQLDPDYYVKTLHHDNYWSAHPRENRYEFQVSPNLSPDHNQFHDNMFDLFPERTIEVMQRVKKPWFAFKVLAGGAIHPREGFPFAFDNGADFICVGMFDFELVEDVNIALEALSQCSRGPRQWLT